MSSSILVATPAPTALPTIYRAGDLLLDNPQQTGVIFVAVILFSAFLEYFLQWVTNLENRYARVLVNTMSQEVTIVGVLALFLMFSISVIPRALMKPLYVQLFNWANISLFFLAVIFVFVVVVQFGWASLETRYIWKAFEEGTLETEETNKLKYPHRIFKQIHELYRQELLAKSGLPTGAVPFNEYTALIWRRSLVRLSNLSFRTWFFLSFVILLNLVRIMFIPWANGLSGNDLAFFNQLTLMAIIGWGMFLSYVFFFLLLQSRIARVATGRIVLNKDEHGYNLIPCGTLKRAVEYIQILVFSYSWYIVLFITGGYRQIADLTLAWQKAVLLVMFFLPMIVFLVTLPWCIHCMCMLHIIGNVNSKIILGIFRRIRGEGEEDDDEDDDDAEDDDEAEQAIANIARQMKHGAAASSDKGSARGGDRKPRAMKQQGSDKKSDGASSGSGGLKAGMLADTKDQDDPNKQERPAWAEDDDDWDGSVTLSYGQRRNQVEKQKAGALFVNNADSDRIRKELRRMGVIPADAEEQAKIDAAQERILRREDEERTAAAAATAKASGKPGPKGKGPGGKAALAKIAAAKRALAQMSPAQRAASEARKKVLEEKQKEAEKLKRKAERAEKKKRPDFLDSDEDWDPEEGIRNKKE